MPECSMTPAEAKIITIQVQNRPRSAAAASVWVLATKPEVSGKPAIETAPMMQKMVVSGIDLCRPPRAEALQVPTCVSTAPMLMNNSDL